MNDEILRVFSTVKTEYKKRILFRGTLIAGIGAILLVLAGIYISEPLLSRIGWLVFLIGGLLILIGLLPYRRLTLLESNPNELLLDHNTQTMSYIMKKRVILTIPLSSISDIKYLEKKNLYGLKVEIKEAVENKTIIHRPLPRDPLSSPRIKRRDGIVEIFLPFISERSYTKIKNQ